MTTVLPVSSIAARGLTSVSLGMSPLRTRALTSFGMRSSSDRCVLESRSFHERFSVVVGVVRDMSMCLLQKKDCYFFTAAFLARSKSSCCARLAWLRRAYSQSVPCDLCGMLSILTASLRLILYSRIRVEMRLSRLRLRSSVAVMDESLGELLRRGDGDRLRVVGLIYNYLAYTMKIYYLYRLFILGHQKHHPHTREDNGGNSGGVLGYKNLKSPVERVAPQKRQSRT